MEGPVEAGQMQIAGPTYMVGIFTANIGGFVKMQVSLQ
jgi:hypothetical protein